MPISGGGDRKDLRPLDQSGQTMGTHRGNYEALNVRNVQPGFRYCWARKKQGAMYKKLNQGWEFVRKDDPENLGIEAEGLPVGIQEGLDSLQPFGDVVLMRQSGEKYAEQLKLQQELAKAAREGAESQFLAKGEIRAGEAGVAAGDAPLHFARKQHGTFMTED